MPARRLIGVIGLALVLGYIVLLGGTWLQGHFLTDRQGQPIANDFVSVHAAGQLTLGGNPVAAYDWTAHRAAEAKAVGHDFPGYYSWQYPPPALFVATSLAMLPYLAAALIWIIGSLAVYVTTLCLIFRDRIGVFAAVGFPATIWNITAGQNGFLTATLIGGTLGLLERRPVLAGVCLGLLTYKPQFGLLFPLVLIADRRWLTLAVAGAVAFVMVAASWLAFGAGPWHSFFQAMQIANRVMLGEGAGDWSRLQSLFGFVRSHGGSEILAWIMQAVGCVAVAAAIVWLWRSRVPFDLKAAALAAATLLVTPYVYMYDLVVLAVAVSFLLRFALHRGFSAAEIAALAASCLLILIYPYAKTQVGLAAAAIVMIAATQRALAARREDWT